MNIAVTSYAKQEPQWVYENDLLKVFKHSKTHDTVLIQTALLVHTVISFYNYRTDEYDSTLVSDCIKKIALNVERL